MQKRSKRLCLVLAVLLSVSMALVALAPAVEAASTAGASATSTMLTKSSTASARHKRLDRFCIYKTPSQTFGSSLRRSVFLIRANLKNQLLRDLTSACRRAMKSERLSTLCSPARVRTELVSFSASLSPRTSIYGIF